MKKKEVNPQEIYERALTKYYYPTNPIWRRWKHEQFPFAGNKVDVLMRIKELMEQGFEVKGGYSKTKIRGNHDHWLFYR